MRPACFQIIVKLYDNYTFIICFELILPRSTKSMMRDGDDGHIKQGNDGDANDINKGDDNTFLKSNDGDDNDL